MKIIKGDKVKILSGKDRGREGTVTRCFPKKQTIIVGGVNLFKKHLKSTRDRKGGIIEKERPLSVAKVALICPSCHKATRVGYQIDQAKDKYRICKKCRSPLAVKKQS